MGDVPFPSWEPHPDVWLVVGLLVAGYATAVVRLGPRLHTGEGPPVRRFHVVCFVAGIGALWLASDWPIHDVAEGYLFSVHMAQHLVYSLITAPLLILATPAWLARAILSPPRLLATVRVLARFLPATLLFNAVVVVTHVPAVVDASVRSGLVHFVVHVLVVVSSLLVWMPVLSPLPEVPRLGAPLRMLFLFLQGVVPTVPASFLTFGERPLYRVYEELPRLWGVSALDDMRVAGLVMKLAAGMILWVVIAVIFFRWYAEEERTSVPGRRDDLDRELERLELERR